MRAKENKRHNDTRLMTFYKRDELGISVRDTICTRKKYNNNKDYGMMNELAAKKLECNKMN